MTRFNIEIDDHLPEYIFVNVDRRYEIAIERTEEGLSLRIYPRTNDELWDFPFATFEVDESEVTKLEAEMEDTP